jgi:hypothetical protein
MSANDIQHGVPPSEYQITLSRNYICYVDEDVFDAIHHLKWSAVTPSKTLVYAARYDHGQFIYLHRLIMEAKKGDIVDHIDGNTLNNTRANLRFVTKTENSFNKAGGYGVSKYRGVWYRSDRKTPWQAEIRVHGKKIWLGQFMTEIEAANAYDAALMQYFPNHGRPNNAE